MSMKMENNRGSNTELWYARGDGSLGWKIVRSENAEMRQFLEKQKMVDRIKCLREVKQESRVTVLLSMASLMSLVSLTSAVCILWPLWNLFWRESRTLRQWKNWSKTMHSRTLERKQKREMGRNSDGYERNRVLGRGMASDNFQADGKTEELRDIMRRSKITVKMTERNETSTDRLHRPDALDLLLASANTRFHALQG